MRVRRTTRGLLRTGCRHGDGCSPNPLKAKALQQTAASMASATCPRSRRARTACRGAFLSRFKSAAQPKSGLWHATHMANSRTDRRQIGSAPSPRPATTLSAQMASDHLYRRQIARSDSREKASEAGTSIGIPAHKWDFAEIAPAIPHQFVCVYVRESGWVGPAVHWDAPSDGNAKCVG